MKAELENKTKLEKMIGALENIAEHRKRHPTTRVEELYYTLLAKYYRDVHEAKAEGKFIGAHTVMCPPELLRAMDIVPLHLESGSSTMAILLKNYAEYFDQASAFGYAPEVCSAHRLLAGTFLKGDFPRPDFMIWSNQVCDNTAKSGDALTELYGIPGFYLDRPYNSSEKEVQYYIKQIEYLIAFLEEQTGKSMDYGRLSEVVALAERVHKLAREIYEMRKTSPAPMRNRASMNLRIIEWLWSGTPEAVRYFETIRDEVKAQIGKKEEVENQENYRLLSIFAPPFYEMKMLDWMEREYGAKIAIDYGSSWWAEGEMDPSRPVESLARQSFYHPGARQMHGPGLNFMEDTVKLAKDFRVNGALYYAHIGCRQACAMIRAVRDKLRDEAGIPTLVLDCDIMDPSLTPEGEMRSKLEGFFEMLEQ